MSSPAPPTTCLSSLPGDCDSNSYESTGAWRGAGARYRYATKRVVPHFELLDDDVQSGHMRETEAALVTQPPPPSDSKVPAPK